MYISDQIWSHYLETPRTNARPTKIDRILERRLKRHSYVRSIRLRELDSE